MTTQRKQALKDELKNRTAAATAAGNTATPFTRCQNLLSFLMRANPIYSNSGKEIVPTIRAYLLKHDRKEYRHIIRGIRINRMDNCFKLFNNGFGVNLSGCFKSMKDLKLTDLDTATVNTNIIQFK